MTNFKSFFITFFNNYTFYYLIIKSTINVIANNNLNDEINKEMNKDIGKSKIIKVNKKNISENGKLNNNFILKEKSDSSIVKCLEAKNKNKKEESFSKKSQQIGQITSKYAINAILTNVINQNQNISKDLSENSKVIINNSDKTYKKNIFNIIYMN